MRVSVELRRASIHGADDADRRFRSDDVAPPNVLIGVEHDVARLIAKTTGLGSEPLDDPTSETDGGLIGAD